MSKLTENQIRDLCSPAYISQVCADFGLKSLPDPGDPQFAPDDSPKFTRYLVNHVKPSMCDTEHIKWLLAYIFVLRAQRLIEADRRLRAQSPVMQHNNWLKRMKTEMREGYGEGIYARPRSLCLYAIDLLTRSFLGFSPAYLYREHRRRGNGGLWRRFVRVYWRESRCRLKCLCKYGSLFSINRHTE